MQTLGRVSCCPARHAIAGAAMLDDWQDLLQFFFIKKKQQYYLWFVSSLCENQVLLYIAKYSLKIQVFYMQF